MLQVTEVFILSRRPLDVINSFYSIRADFYAKRKSYMIGKLTDEWEKLDNKVSLALLQLFEQFI
jgi:hypothetical protein